MELPKRTPEEQKDADEFFNELEREFNRLRRIEERDYLDRVALEAMKIILGDSEWFREEEGEPEFTLDSVARESYQLARAMLKARSQGGAE